VDELELKIKAIKAKTFYQSIELKEVTSTDEYLIIKGYANRFKDDNGNLVIDRDSDLVVPQGMNIDNYKKNPIILYNHDRDAIIGKSVDVQLRDDGVFMEMHVYKSLNQRVYEAIRLGVLKTCSIGFIVNDLKYMPELEAYLLTSCELLENSIVVLPANQDSLLTSVSVGGNPMLTLSSKSVDSIEKEYKKLLDETNDNQEPQDLLKEVRDTLEVLKTFIQNNTLKEVETVDEIVKSEEDLEVSKESPEPKEVILDKEVVTEDNKEVEKETPNIEELISSTEVSEDNFNTLLQITENLQSKLNTFLQEHLN